MRRIDTTVPGVNGGKAVCKGLIMRKLLFAMSGMTAIGEALTAYAGPDRVNKVMLSLDHCRYAQTASWPNQQRLRRAEGEAREGASPKRANAGFRQITQRIFPSIE
jgi:hypothetical protein